MQAAASAESPHLPRPLALPALDSGCTWSLKTHKVKIPQGADDWPEHSHKALPCQSMGGPDASHHRGCVLFPSGWDAKLLPDWGIIPGVSRSGTCHTLV